MFTIVILNFHYNWLVKGMCSVFKRLEMLYHIQLTQFFSNRAMALLMTEDQETFSSEMLQITKYYQQHTGTLMKSNPIIFFL